MWQDANVVTAVAKYKKDVCTINIDAGINNADYTDLPFEIDSRRQCNL